MLVDTIGRYGDRHSANMSAETQSSVGQHEPTSMSADTRLILHRHLADTSQTLGQQYAHLVSSLLPSFHSFFFALLREAFSGCYPFLAFNSGNIDVFFPAMFFPHHRFYIQPSLLLDVTAFGDCCFFPSIGHSGICVTWKAKTDTNGFPLNG